MKFLQLFWYFMINYSVHFHAYFRNICIICTFPYYLENDQVELTSCQQKQQKLRATLQIIQIHLQGLAAKFILNREKRFNFLKNTSRCFVE